MQEPSRQEQAREPVPGSFRPVWMFMGWMLLVVIVIGLAAAAIAILVG